MFWRGRFVEALRERTQRALACGVLQPIATDCALIEDAGVTFQVRVAAALEGKHAARRAPGRRDTDPFLPYDEALFVADVSPTHVCLLNRFNVLDHHLLIVTRDFEDQQAPLSLRDFEALWTCMAEFEALGFYNAGEAAGASQRHKHLQLVPLPLGPGAERIPIDVLVRAACFEGRVGRAPGLPFAHALARLDADATPARAAEASLSLHGEMLNALGADRESTPFNLLVTSEWMLLVPRRREHFESISVNALGFAGSFFVRDREQLETVRARGPMSILRHVAGDQSP